MSKKEIFTVKSYAKHKGVSRQTVYKWIRKKKVESFREYGGKLFIKDYVDKDKKEGGS